MLSPRASPDAVLLSAIIRIVYRITVIFTSSSFAATAEGPKFLKHLLRHLETDDTGGGNIVEMIENIQVCLFISINITIFAFVYSFFIIVIVCFWK